MRIAIVGGTGTLGSRLVKELRRRGHDVRSLSRSGPQLRVDLTSGAGLSAALTGCDTVIDASNNASKSAAATLIDGTERLLAAARETGVKHHICVSVIGCDLVPLRYFQIKHQQERTVEQGSVPWSIVRSTQFHEFVAATLTSLGSWGLLPLPGARLQPISAAEVAQLLVRIAEGAPLRRRINIAGPEIADLRDFARVWRSQSRRRAVIVPVPFPGAAGRALRSGALTCSQPDVRGDLSFAAALSQPAQSSPPGEPARSWSKTASPRPTDAAPG